MDVSIGEVQSAVRVVDSDALLSPRVMQHIVRMVLAAVRDEESHRQRVHDEQRVSAGRDHGHE